VYARGVVIGGKYRLENLIGEGGMATVWRAEHADLGRAVAVKFIELSGPNSERAAQRFLREARVAASRRPCAPWRRHWRG
jgi:serine/threonine-protein kinase